MIPGSRLRLWSFLLNLHRSALSTTQNDHNQLTCKKEEKRVPNLPARCAEYHQHQANLVGDGCSNGWTGRGQQEWRIGAKVFKARRNMGRAPGGGSWYLVGHMTSPPRQQQPQPNPRACAPACTLRCQLLPSHLRPQPSF